MQLLRVRVPNFRALKDVDITFEKDFVPQIFPLGSLNGGGKSTLLQLIFVLLHRPTDKSDYIKNVLDYIVFDGNEEAIIATFEIWDGKQNIVLEFSCYSANYFYNRLGATKDKPQVVLDYLRKEEILYITKNEDNAILCCRSQDVDLMKLPILLSQLSKKVFLASPSSQIYIFLPSAERKLLFQSKGNTLYSEALERLKQTLPELFTYDALSIATIVDFFKTARDKDFEEIVRTGQYGNHYSRMKNNIDQLISGKTVTPKVDVSHLITSGDSIEGLTFRLNDSLEIFPEDLSHGELHKLSVFAWLKSRHIEKSIVLMDEIENAFHPDWQFQIVKELEAWEPSNQYILATHSYELCTALTPSHVKELEPKLLSTPK